MSEPRIRWTMPAQRARLLRDLLGAVDDGRGADGWRAVAGSLLGELQRAMSAATARTGAKLPAQKFAKPSALDREKKRDEKHGRKARNTMKVYDLVRLRSGGMCECGCERPFNAGPMLDSAPEMDDFFGGAKHRNSRECWMLRAECHRAKTANKPDRAVWLRKFISHCHRYGFDFERKRAEAKLDSREAIAKASEVSRGAR